MKKDEREWKGKVLTIVSTCELMGDDGKWRDVRKLVGCGNVPDVREMCKFLDWGDCFLEMVVNVDEQSASHAYAVSDMRIRRILTNSLVGMVTGDLLLKETGRMNRRVDVSMRFECHAEGVSCGSSE
ncbi:hypothetical protein Tco_0599518 [Tanacetum coccineum]